MTGTPGRGPPREAGAELLVLASWEEFTDVLLGETARWPKNLRFTLTQRVENHALDVLEKLVAARYEPGARSVLLREINLTLERMRFLFRLAQKRGVLGARNFERAMRGTDDAGRMVHGWRRSIERKTPRAGLPS
ncbi:MAG: four helix bundle protein [Planctomycetes bacterium]|nr:four helix bundle protein [Planctomycetota bacterium]